MLYNINLLGFLFIIVLFLFGIKLLDWDFKLGFRYRNILIYSFFIIIIFIVLYEIKISYFFKYFIVGFLIVIVIYIFFDLFLRKWYGGVLLKIFFNNISCLEEIIKIFFVIIVLISIFLGIFYMIEI